ncbi:MAG: hypothetical protein P8099_01715 [Gemmatimonadota bacterium]|jgi:hypothetical protein
MSYLIGWGLLLGLGAVGFVFMRRAGPPGGSREPSATCGTGECGCGGRAVTDRR